MSSNGIIPSVPRMPSSVNGQLARTPICSKEISFLMLGHRGPLLCSHGQFFVVLTDAMLASTPSWRSGLGTMTRSGCSVVFCQMVHWRNGLRSHGRFCHPVFGPFPTKGRCGLPPCLQMMHRGPSMVLRSSVELCRALG